MHLLRPHKSPPPTNLNKPLTETRLREMATRLEDYLWKESANNIEARPCPFVWVVLVAGWLIAIGAVPVLICGGGWKCLVDLWYIGLLFFSVCKGECDVGEGEGAEPVVLAKSQP